MGRPAGSIGLAPLWDEVVRARTDVAQERQDPQRRSGQEARHVLIAALEDYLGEIASRRYPAPYALVNELHLQRVVCARYPTGLDTF